MQVHFTFCFPLATGLISGADDSSAAIGMHVSKALHAHHQVAPDTWIAERCSYLLCRRPATRERVGSADRALIETLTLQLGVGAIV